MQRKGIWVIPTIAILTGSLMFVGISQNASAKSISVQMVMSPTVKLGWSQGLLVTVGGDWKPLKGANVSVRVGGSCDGKNFGGTTNSIGTWSKSWKVTGSSGWCKVIVTAYKYDYGSRTIERSFYIFK